MRSLANAEVDVMIDAIDSFTERLDTFIERDLCRMPAVRTPIAVFKGSLDLLQRQSERPQEDARALAMRRTVEDMEGLIQTLLLLARGEEVEQPGVRLRLNDLVPELIDQVTSAQRIAESNWYWSSLPPMGAGTGSGRADTHH